MADYRTQQRLAVLALVSWTKVAMTSHHQLANRKDTESLKVCFRVLSHRVDGRLVAASSGKQQNIK
jgi:hypothetical protein